MATVARSSGGASGPGELGPGGTVAGRWRVAGIAGRFGDATLVHAVDERDRRRVRLLVGDLLPAADALSDDPNLPAPVAEVPLGRDASGRSRSAVAFAWWEGEPLALGRPLASRGEVLAWTRRVIAAYALLERIHEATGQAHGHLSLGSFWSAGGEKLVLVDLRAPAAPDPRFCSPDADPEDPRTDVYALAAVFWSLAAGRLPFGDGPAAAVGHRLARLPDVDPLPAPLVDVLRTALQKQPHHRFASAGRARLAFEQALAELEGAPAAPPAAAPELLPVPAIRARAVPEREDAEPDGTSQDGGTLDPSPARVAGPPRPALAGPAPSLRPSGPRRARRAVGSAAAVIALGAAVGVVGWVAVVALFLAVGLLA